MNGLLYCRQNQVAEGRPLGGILKGAGSPLEAFSFPDFFSAKRNRALSAQDARPARAITPGSPETSSWCGEHTDFGKKEGILFLL